MGARIFPQLTKLTSFFAASVARSGVIPLILQASNTTTRFSSRSSNFCNFTPRIHQKGSQKVSTPNFSWGSMPLDPPSSCPTCTLIAYWNPLFKILDTCAWFRSENFIVTFDGCSQACSWDPCKLKICMVCILLCLAHSGLQKETGGDKWGNYLGANELS